MSGAVRRERIADAVIIVLGEQGSRRLTHRAVDHQADLSPGSTSYYFRTRADLLEAAGVVRPERRLRNAARETAGVGARVPGAAVVADDHVGDERAVALRVGPRPAEAGGHAGGEAFDGARADGGLDGVG